MVSFSVRVQHIFSAELPIKARLPQVSPAAPGTVHRILRPTSATGPSCRAADQGATDAEPRIPPAAATASNAQAAHPPLSQGGPAELLHKQRSLLGWTR